MIKIITKNKTYLWNYKRCFKNLLKLVLFILFILAFGKVGKMDYEAFNIIK